MMVTMTDSVTRSSPLATVLLALLLEEPMHAYRMRQLIRERSKNSVVNVIRTNSVYQSVDRLRRDGLVRVHKTQRSTGRPDRTIYEITEHGRATLQQWLDAMLSTPAREFPEFPAALATISATTPANALHQLRQRAAALTDVITQAEAELTAAVESVPRLFLIEDEYRIAIYRTELHWIRSIINDIEAGKLTWSQEWLDSLARD